VDGGEGGAGGGECDPLRSAARGEAAAVIVLLLTTILFVWALELAAVSVARMVVAWLPG